MKSRTSPNPETIETSLTPEELFKDQPEKLNIVLGSETSVISGPMNKLMHLAPFFAEAGHNLTIILPNKDSSKFGDLGGAKVIDTSFIKITEFELSVLQFPKVIDKKLRSNGVDPKKIDIFHAATPMRGPFNSFFLAGSLIDMAYKMDKPIVAGAQSFNRDIARSTITTVANRHQIPGLLKIAAPLVDNFVIKQEKTMHSKADINFSPSPAMDRYILERGISKNKLVRLANGINPAFSRSRRELEEAKSQRQSWGVKPSEIVLLVPGRLSSEKSLEKLVHITSLPKTKLVIVGDGPERQKLEKLLPNAIFTGMLRDKDLANAYANGDILVLTSDTESYSQVLFEGYASSLPVVAPNSGAFVDLVEEGVVGLKYDSGPTLVAAVEKLVHDQKLRQTMANNAHSLSPESWYDNFKRTEKIYRLAIYLHQRPHLSQDVIAKTIAALDLGI